MKKVVILRSNPISPDPRVEKEARALTDAGYQVTVVGWDRFGKLQKLEQTEFATIERITIPATFGNGLRNLPHLFKWQLALFKWLVTNKYDVVHTCDFDTVIPAFFVSKFKRSKVVYDIFDFYSEMLRKTPTLIKRIIRKIDYFLINHVDAVIIADDSRKEQIKGTIPKRLQVIYNSPLDITHYQLSRIEPQRGEFHISYVGLLQVERGLIEIIEVIGKHPEWSMDIAGFGGDENEIKSEISKYANINYHGRVDYNKSIELSNKADVLFATYDPLIPNHKYSSPNKLFESMMLGKPIIVSANSGMDDIVRENVNGLVVKYGDKFELEKALLELKNNHSLRTTLAINSRKAYENRYGWHVMEERLKNLYLTLNA